MSAVMVKKRGVDSELQPCPSDDPLILHRPDGLSYPRFEKKEEETADQQEYHAEESVLADD